MKNFYVSVAGVMGSGKTTMCNFLAKELGFNLFEEKVNENPYLASYYEEPKKWAFKSQLFYLQEKTSQLEEVKKLLAAKSVIQDTPIYQDGFSYAQAQKILGYMNDDEYQTYLKHLHAALPTLPAPDMIVQLDAPAEVLEARIRERARPYEKAVDKTYLELLSKLQNEWIGKHPHLKIIRVRTDDKENDLLLNEKYRQEFIRKIKTALV